MLGFDSAPPEFVHSVPLDLGVDPLLLKGVIYGTDIGLRMTGAKLLPVGTSRAATSRHGITTMVGLTGRHSGNMAMNLSEPAALYLAGALLSRSFESFDEDCVDAIMELGNMVAGGVKRILVGSTHAIEYISLPSLVLGNGCTVSYARGISVVSVEFELTEMPFSITNARHFSTILSLMRTPGV